MAESGDMQMEVLEAESELAPMEGNYKLIYLNDMEVEYVEDLYAYCAFGEWSYAISLAVTVVPDTTAQDDPLQGSFTVRL